MRTALGLSWGDRWILAQVWVLLLAVDLGLRTLPFRRVQRLLGLGRRDGAPAEAKETSDTIRHLGKLVGMAGRHHLYPMRCLRQSLVLQWLLAQRGIITELQIGVRKEVDGLSAHAWLEHGGQPIDEPQTIENHFAPLAARSVN